MRTAKSIVASLVIYCIPMTVFRGIQQKWSGVGPKLGITRGEIITPFS